MLDSYLAEFMCRQEKGDEYPFRLLIISMQTIPPAKQIIQLSLIYILVWAVADSRQKTAKLGSSQMHRHQQQVSRRGQLVHMCGTYPYRYIYLGPCPENEDDLGQQYSDEECSQGGELTGQSCSSDYECGPYQDDVECDQGVCCTLPPSAPVTYWDTCENGGYFMSAPCNNDAQCNRGGNRDRRLQICLRGECCTSTTADPSEKEEQESDESIDYSSNQWNVDCTNQGYYLNQSCNRDAQCNRVRNLYLASNEQVACIQGSCCVMPRRLPTGTQSWLDVCPTGGKYLGAFCDEDQDCGVDPNQGRICEQQRYCCTDPDYITEKENGPRNPRDDGIEEEMCDEPADRATQRPCSTDFNCASFNDEYCGDGGFCCIPNNIGDRSGLPPPPVLPTNLCSNGGRPLGVRCRLDVDCNRGYPGYRTQVCLDEGVCCTVPGGVNPPPNNNILQLEEEEQEEDLNEADVQGETQQPISSYALCYNRQRSRVRCTSQDRCKSNQSCINGLCCTRTGDEWQNACGGTTAVSSCFADRSCQDKLFCTSSAFCCECPYGQAASKCSSGCPPNYVCEVNGYCCPRCPGDQLPYGSCYNNQCAENHFCRKGNICCPA